MGTQIGYTAQQKERKEPVISENIIFQFDSGATLTAPQMVRNTMVTGQTGSGKTESVIRPMLAHLLENGFAGIIFDVKGSLRDDVRSLARAFHRSQDIVELGSGESAENVNLLRALSTHEKESFLRYIATEGLTDDPNIFWHIKGANIASDIISMLAILTKCYPDSELFQAFEPSLAFVYDVLRSRYLQWSLFALLQWETDKIHDPVLKREAEQLIADISVNAFHLLSSEYSRDNTREAQITWQMQRIIDQLHAMKITHQLLDRFSHGERILDLRKLLYEEHAIVLIHFATDSGRSGEILSAFLKNLYYQTILRHGLENEAYTFMLCDEFQHVLNTDRSQFLNDMDILCISRQFNIINIFSTQNIASLFAKGGRNAVLSLLGNCSNRLFLQNMDSETAKLSASPERVATLSLGECLYETIDQKHGLESTEETVQKEFLRVQKLCQKQQKERKRMRSFCSLPACLDRVLFTAYRKFSQKPRKKMEIIQEMCETLYAARNLKHLTNISYDDLLEMKDGISVYSEQDDMEEEYRLELLRESR